MKSTVSLLLFITSGFTSAFSQDRIYWGDQNGPSNNDNIASVSAGDLGSGTTAYTEFALNPNGIAYYNANPTYPLFYVSNRIYRNDLAGNSDDIIIPSGQFSRGIAIDYAAKKIYWTNSSDGYIGRADIDGSNADETFITGVPGAWDVEIDPVHQKIYWSATNYPETNVSIQRANLSDGSNVETLVSNINSQGIAVDPVGGKIYYTVFETGYVYSANLDGSGGSDHITGLSANADIDFDVRTGKLMMIDYSNSLLTRANPDGSSKVFVSASGTFIAYADVTAPSISSIARLAPASVNVGEGGTAQFRVTFSEPVLGVDAADFELGGTPTGSISVSPVSLNTVYDIVVSDISGIGTLDLNLANSHDVTDFGGNAAGGAIGAEETYTVITVPDPTISSFDPLSGAEGTTVTITGTNFSITPGDNVVKFNDVPSVVTASTVTSISTTVPATVPVGAAEITVTVNGRTATGATMFTVLCTPPPKPTIATDGGLLTSSSDSDNQWLRNGSEIAGATSKTFTPTDPGSYTVKVTSEGCSTESDPTTIVGAEEFVSSGVTIFPNPARSLVRVEVNASASNVTAELYTVTGERKETVPLKVMHGRAAGELYVADYPAGIYVMKIATDRRVIMKKLYLVSSGR